MNRILVVDDEQSIADDEQSIADMVKLCLSKNGYICEAVYYGMTATEKIESNRYDLILLDIMLHDIDGYDLIEYIKQFDIPVIFVTAKTTVPGRKEQMKILTDFCVSFIPKAETYQGLVPPH